MAEPAVASSIQPAMARTTPGPTSTWNTSPVARRSVHWHRKRRPNRACHRRRPRLPARHGQNEPELVVGHSNWLFAGSLRAGKRVAAVMSLLHSARINGHDPYAYFKDVLERLPTHPASRIDELLPHRWSPAS